MVGLYVNHFLSCSFNFLASKCLNCSHLIKFQPEKICVQYVPQILCSLYEHFNVQVSAHRRQLLLVQN
jgi:hypothetical protein